MQASIILKKPLTTEWAVVGTRYHVPVKYRHPEKVSRNQMSKVRIQSFEYYHKTSAIRDGADGFAKTAPGSRDPKGFLVSDGERFWVAPSADFIAEYKECEAVWAAAEAVQAAAQAAANAMREREQNAQAAMYKRAQDRTESILGTVRSILGESAMGSVVTRITPDIRRRDDGSIVGTLQGTVTLTLREFERLIEKYTEALEDAR